MESKAAELDTLRRRALYRAQHRGTREMDWLLGRYAEAALPAMDADALSTFEHLLARADPEVHGWILDGAAGEAMFQPLIAAIRRCHGLS